MRPWHVLLIVIPILGFLSFRVMSLEDRIGLLYEMVEIQSRDAKESVAGEDRADEPDEPYEASDKPEQQQPEQQPAGLEELRARVDRLEALLDEVEVVEAQEGTTVSKAAIPDPGKKEKFQDYVRSVVRSEADRLRDEQLLKHRDALVENRMRAVSDFAKQAGLSPNQENSIASILTEEADRMVELLKQPEVLEEPPKALKKWGEMLKETDEQASEVLNPAQMLLYMQLRRLEQDALMPWLPKENR
jgi:hypothetical protein